MVPLDSELDGKILDLIHSKNELERLRFTYGGNWDYEHGSFDRFLDDERTVWLRLPFRMVQGQMDADEEDTEARFRFDRPYVLRHLYREGPDLDADARTLGALIDQFQEPTDKDAHIAPEWVTEAASILREAERLLLS